MPAKRVYDALVDFDSDIDSDCMETSLDESMSQSLLDESLGTRGESYWKQRCLKAEESLKTERAKYQAEVAELKKKYEADIAASRDLFLVRTRPSRANGSGQARSYGKELKAIMLDAAGHGVASADIEKVLKSVLRFIDFPEEEGTRKVPCVDHINKLRTSDLASLVDKQTQQWVEDAEIVALSVDATTMSGNHYIALGGFNHHTQYHCLAIKEIDAKSGVEIASVMYALINQIPGLKDKIRFIIADRAASQENANKRLQELLNRDRPEDQLIILIICMMHSVIGCDNRSYEKLSVDTKAASSLLAQIFGSRKSQQLRKACLKKELREVCEGSPGFDTKMGSRYHVNKANGVALIQFEEEVKMVLAAKANPHPKQTQLQEYMASPTWNRVRLEMGIPVVLWVSIIGPFHTTISARQPYGEIKNAFRTAFTAIDEVLSADNAFTRALTMALAKYPAEDDIQDHTKQALDRLANEYWSVAGVRLKRQIQATTVIAFNECKVKLERDWVIMSDLGIDDDYVMEWSQRKMESSFAFLKSMDRRFDTMRPENVQVLARARQNHTSSWVAYDLEKITDHSVKKAYYERMEKYEHDFTLADAVESFTDAL